MINLLGIVANKQFLSQINGRSNYDLIEKIKENKKSSFKVVSFGNLDLILYGICNRGFINNFYYEKNEKSTVLVAIKGLIFNKVELLKLLGIKNTSCSLGFMLLRLYEKYDVEFIRKISGHFAICLYDENRRQIILATDHMGRIPFYYYINKKYFYFSTRLLDLLNGIKEPKYIDLSALRTLLLYGFVPGPYTIIKDIMKVKAGNVIIINLDNFQKVRAATYWDIFKIIENKNNSDLKAQPLNSLLHEFEYLITNSLLSIIDQFSNIGLFLSSGIDSGCLFFLTSNLIDNLKCFTGIFHESAKYDESKAMKHLIGNKTNNSNIFNFVEIRKEAVLDMIFGKPLFDEPILSYAYIPRYILAKCSKGVSDCIITGEGGDELFGGYPYYKIIRQIAKFMMLLNNKIIRNELNKFRNTINKLLYFNKMKYFYWSNVLLSCDLYEILSIPVFSTQAQLKKLFRVEFNNDYWDCEISKIKNKNYKDILEIIMAFDLNYYLFNYDLVNLRIAEEKNNIYIFHLLLDKNIIEFALKKVPIKYKTGKNKQKIFLRGYLKKYIIDNTHINKKKSGFEMPFKLWLDDKKITRSIKEELLTNEYLNNKYIKNINLSNLDERQIIFWLGLILLFSWIKFNKINI